MWCFSLLSPDAIQFFSYFSAVPLCHSRLLMPLCTGRASAINLSPVATVVNCALTTSCAARDAFDAIEACEGSEDLGFFIPLFEIKNCQTMWHNIVARGASLDRMWNDEKLIKISRVLWVEKIQKTTRILSKVPHMWWERDAHRALFDDPLSRTCCPRKTRSRCCPKKTLNYALKVENRWRKKKIPRGTNLNFRLESPFVVFILVWAQDEDKKWI